MTFFKLYDSLDDKGVGGTDIVWGWHILMNHLRIIST